jgi:hypothetical protein
VPSSNPVDRVLNLIAKFRFWNHEGTGSLCSLSLECRAERQLSMAD